MRRTTAGVAVLAGTLMGATLLVAPTALADDANATAAPSTIPTAADIPDGYYDDADGKTGDELKAALHEIISGNDQLSYDETWEALEETDQDPDNENNVIQLYTGDSVSEGDWNREHVWPQSHGDFGTSIGPGTDLHHLRPTDERVNSIRSNLDFDMGGEEVEGAPGNFVDEDSFEPHDDHKGDVARMILYMEIRFEGTDGGSDVNLEVNDEVENSPEPLHGRISVLKEWSEQDPPDEFEKNRNNVIYENYQGNRNPFIDNPDWVDSIWP